MSDVAAAVVDAAPAADAAPITPVVDAGASTETPVVASGDTLLTPAAPAVVEPIAYDLKLPETPSLDPAAIERTVAIARERGLSQEQAQAALDLANTEAASAVTAAVKAANDALLADWAPGDPATKTPPGKAWAAQHTEWLAASLNDPELGAGKQDQLNTKVATAGKAFEHFASPEFRAFLGNTGYGSHPEVLRVFAKIGEAMAEGSLVVAGAESSGRMSTESVFYGKKD